jgi:hypothetical protein
VLASVAVVISMARRRKGFALALKEWRHEKRVYKEEEQRPES